MGKAEKRAPGGAALQAGWEKTSDAAKRPSAVRYGLDPHTGEPEAAATLADV